MGEAADPPAQHRRHRPPGQGRRIRSWQPTFDAEEAEAIRRAAAAVGLTPTGYVAAVAVATARAMSPPTPTPLQDALAAVEGLSTQLRRAATNLNQAVAQAHATGAAPVWLTDAVRLTAAAIARVDKVCDRVDRTLP